MARLDHGRDPALDETAGRSAESAWDGDGDPGAAARGALDREFASEGADALANVEQPNTSRTGWLAVPRHNIEAGALIGHDHAHFLTWDGSRRADMNRGARSMLHRVQQELPDGPKEEHPQIDAFRIRRTVGFDSDEDAMF